MLSCMVKVTLGPLDEVPEDVAEAAIEARIEYEQVIPEGAGPCQPRGPGGCDRFVPVPGSVRAYAGEGSGSRLDRRSTRASGLGLDAGSERRRIVAPGTQW